MAACLASPNKPPKHWWLISPGHGGGITLTCVWCRKRVDSKPDTYWRTYNSGEQPEIVTPPNQQAGSTQYLPVSGG